MALEVSMRMHKGGQLEVLKGIGSTYLLSLEFKEIILKIQIQEKGDKRRAKILCIQVSFPSTQVNKHNSRILPDDPEGSLRVNLSGWNFPSDVTWWCHNISELEGIGDIETVNCDSLVWEWQWIFMYELSCNKIEGQIILPAVSGIHLVDVLCLGNSLSVVG